MCHHPTNNIINKLERSKWDVAVMQKYLKSTVSDIVYITYANLTFQYCHTVGSSSDRFQCLYYPHTCSWTLETWRKPIIINSDN